jgi:hypothetical protein
VGYCGFFLLVFFKEKKITPLGDKIKKEKLSSRCQGKIVGECCVLRVRVSTQQHAHKLRREASTVVFTKQNKYSASHQESLTVAILQVFILTGSKMMIGTYPKSDPIHNRIDFGPISSGQKYNIDYTLFTLAVLT